VEYNKNFNNTAFGGRFFFEKDLSGFENLTGLKKTDKNGNKQ